MSDGTAIFIAILAAVVVLRVVEAKKEGAVDAGRGIFREALDEFTGRPRTEF